MNRSKLQAQRVLANEKSSLHLWGKVSASRDVWIKILIILAMTAALAVVFKPVYYSQGNVAGALVVLPVVAAGWLLGLRAGALAGFLSIGLAIALFSTVEAISLSKSVAPWPFYLTSIISGSAVGWLKDLQNRTEGQAADLEREKTALNEQIDQRMKAENAPREVKEGLEAAILQRTDQLIRANESLKEQISQREQAEAFLRDSEERFRLLFNSIDEAIFVCGFKEGGLPAKFYEVNDIACRMLGYTRDELLNLSPYDIDETMRSLDQEIQRSIQKDGHVLFQSVTLAKDGRRIPVEVSAHLFDFRGRPSVMAISRDITQRKIAEEKIKASLKEKEILLKEIHHRVKNNLQIISSLQRLQSKKVKNQEAIDILRESQSRIRSVAMIHEKLYKSGDMARIDFGEYIKSLSVDLLRASGPSSRRVKLRVEAQEIHLNIELIPKPSIT